MNYHPSDADRLRFEPLRWQPLRDAVYESLKAEIMAAHFAPGTLLTVQRTAESLGVSTMPVRAAFARLADERVLQLQGNGGVIVPTLTKRRFHYLQDARVLLEGACAEMAATRISAEDVDLLSTLSRQISEAIAVGAVGSESYTRLDQKFKFIVYAAADQPVLYDLIERLWLQVGPFLQFYVRDSTAQAQTVEYDSIVDALRIGDAAAARAATGRDIEAGREFLIRHGSFSDDGEE